MRPLLIDTDPGIDDALALLLAWGSPEVRVEAITTVAGNVPLDRGTTNVLRLLDLRRHVAAPVVAAGARQPLARPLETAVRYHGADGLGDLPDWPPVDLAAVRPDAPRVIVETARGLGERLTIVALGPLTNLALALAEEAEALRAVGRVVAMGGAVDVPGNVTPEAEFNIHVDPDAAARVIAAGLAFDLVPLDVTRQVTLTRTEFETGLAPWPGPLAARIAAFTQRGFRVERGGMTPHDPLAVGVAIDPTLVEWERVRLDVGPDGATRRADGPPNCRFAQRVDRERFVAMFLDRLCRASS